MKVFDFETMFANRQFKLAEEYLTDDFAEKYFHVITYDGLVLRAIRNLFINN